MPTFNFGARLLNNNAQLLYPTVPFSTAHAAIPAGPTVGPTGGQVSGTQARASQIGFPLPTNSVITGAYALCYGQSTSGFLLSISVLLAYPVDQSIYYTLIGSGMPSLPLAFPPSVDATVTAQQTLSSAIMGSGYWPCVLVQCPTGAISGAIDLSVSLDIIGTTGALSGATDSTARLHLVGATGARG